MMMERARPTLLELLAPVDPATQNDFHRDNYVEAVMMDGLHTPTSLATAEASATALSSAKAFVAATVAAAAAAERQDPTASTQAAAMAAVAAAAAASAVSGAGIGCLNGSFAMPLPAAPMPFSPSSDPAMTGATAGAAEQTVPSTATFSILARRPTNTMTTLLTEHFTVRTGDTVLESSTEAVMVSPSASAESDTDASLRARAARRGTRTNVTFLPEVSVASSTVSSPKVSPRARTGRGTGRMDVNAASRHRKQSDVDLTDAPAGVIVDNSKPLFHLEPATRSDSLSGGFSTNGNTCDFIHHANSTLAMPTDEASVSASPAYTSDLFSSFDPEALFGGSGHGGGGGNAAGHIRVARLSTATSLYSGSQSASTCAAPSKSHRSHLSARMLSTTVGPGGAPSDAAASALSYSASTTPPHRSQSSLLPLSPASSPRAPAAVARVSSQPSESGAVLSSQETVGSPLASTAPHIEGADDVREGGSPGMPSSPAASTPAVLASPSSSSSSLSDSTSANAESEALTATVPDLKQTEEGGSREDSLDVQPRISLPLTTTVPLSSLKRRSNAQAVCNGEEEGEDDDEEADSPTSDTSMHASDSTQRHGNSIPLIFPQELISAVNAVILPPHALHSRTANSSFPSSRSAQEGKQHTQSSMSLRQQTDEPPHSRCDSTAPATASSSVIPHPLPSFPAAPSSPTPLLHSPPPPSLLVAESNADAAGLATPPRLAARATLTSTVPHAAAAATAAARRQPLHAGSEDEMDESDGDGGSPIMLRATQSTFAQSLKRVPAMLIPHSASLWRCWGWAGWALDGFVQLHSRCSTLQLPPLEKGVASDDEEGSSDDDSERRSWMPVTTSMLGESLYRNSILSPNVCPTASHSVFPPLPTAHEDVAVSGGGGSGPGANKRRCTHGGFDGSSTNASGTLYLSFPLSRSGSQAAAIEPEAMPLTPGSTPASQALQQSLRGTWNAGGQSWFSASSHPEPRTALRAMGRIVRPHRTEMTPTSPTLASPRVDSASSASSSHGRPLRLASPSSPCLSFSESFGAAHDPASPPDAFHHGSLLLRSSRKLAGTTSSNSLSRANPSGEHLRTPTASLERPSRGGTRPAATNAILDDQYRAQLYHVFRHPPSMSIGDLSGCFKAYKAMVETASNGHHVLNWKELSLLLLPEDYIDYNGLFPPYHFVTFPDFVEFVEVLSVRYRRKC